MANMMGLNTALTAIRAAQVGLDTASHNVANANTVGYTRQRAVQSSRLPYQSLVGPIGTGTDVQVGRTREAFLDARARVSSAQYGFAETQAGLLQRTEAILGEPDDGLSGELGNLWNSFEDFAVAPDDLASRRQVLSALGGFAGRVRSIAAGWEQLGADSATSFDVVLNEANELFGQVATMNRSIASSGGADGASSDLLDARDKLVDRLATILGVDAVNKADGTVTLSLGGATLVEGATAQRLERDAAFSVTTGAGAPVALRGQSAALQSFLTTELPDQQSRLNDLVGRIATALNTQHAAGYRADGTAGGDLLTFDPAVGARGLALAITAPQDLAAAGDVAADGSVGAHDGRNAAALAELRQRPPSGDDRTIDDRLRALVVDLAGQVSGAKRAENAQASLNLAATVARQSAHGVSLDEEMVSLVVYQRSLEAASRVMTAIDEALQKLVNGTGVVGR